MKNPLPEGVPAQISSNMCKEHRLVHIERRIKQLVSQAKSDDCLHNGLPCKQCIIAYFAKNKKSCAHGAKLLIKEYLQSLK